MIRKGVRIIVSYYASMSTTGTEQLKYIFMLNQSLSSLLANTFYSFDIHLQDEYEIITICFPYNKMSGESLIRTVRQAKIVGGTFAERGEFPHQVYLSYHDEFVCGGSILSTLLILTAAHCVKYKRPNRLKVTAGVYDRSIIGSEQTRTARYIYMHENYVWETDINDIAVIVLAEPLQFTRHVQNISLPREKEEFYGYATVSGWGRTKEKGETTNVLKKVRLPLVDNDECQRRYRKVKMKVTENMLCAGDVGLDACQGDSGGPAICKIGSSHQVLCGIVSHGYGCGRRGYPGIYTKVANYLDWIKKTQEKIIARGKCRSDHFYCSSGPGCIPRTFLCDLESDCGGDNAEDEQGCIYMTNCRRNHFRCNNGRCIKQDYLCDAMDDCGDRSDEDKCPTESKLCVGGQHQCGVGGRCIPDEWKCDSEQDCDDNSDEEGCIYNNSTINTAENEIDNFYIKTTTTAAPCTSEQFYCTRDYRCIPVRWRCDGDRDCRSGADEIGCSNENVESSVTSTSLAPEVITSPPITTTEISTSTLSSGKNCSQGQFQCDDGTCISNVFQCDFDFDCEDHSDEDPAHCPAYETTCFSYFWRCNNGQCIYRKFRCDGDSDCTDNSDEQNCRIYNTTVNSSRRRRNRRRG